MKHNNQYVAVRGLLARNLWLLAIIALVFTWGVCLLLQSSASFASFTLLTLYAVAVLGLLLSLSGRTQRRLVILLFLGGLVLRTAEILLIQTLPQSSDVSPDSIVYDLNAQALMYHWQGWQVDAEDYALPHLTDENRDWLPTDPEPYSFVFGSRHFLYQVYMGIIYFFAGPDQLTVILSHAVTLAALAPAIYCVSNLLFENNRLAALAASLTLIDPGFSAAGAFLWKDALAVFLVTIAFWATVLVSQGRGARYHSVIVLTAALLGLSVLRYHAVVAFWLAAVLVMFLARDRGRTKRLLLVLMLTFLSSAVLYSSFSLGSILSSNLSTMQRAVGTLQASSNESSEPQADPATEENAAQGWEAAPPPEASPNESSDVQADPSVQAWTQSLQENPLLAVTKTVARTLFAPYPWVPFLDGLYYNSIELFYPGVVMWILGLPFLFVALWRLPVRSSPELLLIMLWLLLIVAVYIVVYGEFSTRQRVFMMPLFWILIAFGMEQVRAYYDKRKTTR